MCCRNGRPFRYCADKGRQGFYRISVIKLVKLILKISGKQGLVPEILSKGKIKGEVDTISL